MDIITLDENNLQKEHICCAISNNDDCQVAAKKAWLLQRFSEGIAFKKGNVRGKCFIEYIPSENAWAPIKAEGYMFINCLWVSGRFKGQGWSNLLLKECIKDSKEKAKKGLVIISSKKKMPYLVDPSFLKYKNFELVDTAQPYYELYYLPFDELAEKPSFKQNVKMCNVNQNGFVLYYSNQCPFTAKYVPLIEKIAKEKDVEFKVIKIENKEQAQNLPLIFTTYSLFYNGEFVTHEILSEKKFINLIIEKGL